MTMTLNVEAADGPLADGPPVLVGGPPVGLELAEPLAQAARVKVPAATSTTNLLIGCFTVHPSGSQYQGQ
jgi:hypothetical protein